MLLQQSYIGIDTSPEYIEISRHRIIAAIGSIDTLKDKQSKDKEDKQADIKDKDKIEDTQFFFDNV